MIQIVRYDRRPEPRADEIAADWRGWLAAAGYELFSSAEVNSFGQRMLLSVYRREGGPDPYLLHHPDFRPGGLRETLYLLPDADAMDQMLQRAQVMVAHLLAAAARR